LAESGEGKARLLQIKFGRDLAAARERAGLSQSDVARRLGVKPQYIWAIENGKKNLTIKRMTELAETLQSCLGIILTPRRR
jgi:transcriptional regulator with XRE-family HTH domain